MQLTFIQSSVIDYIIPLASQVKFKDVRVHRDAIYGSNHFLDKAHYGSGDKVPNRQMDITFIRDNGGK